MDEKIESRKVLICNFVFASLLILSFTSIGISIKFKRIVEIRDLINLGAYALTFSFVYNIFNTNRVSYEDLVIDDFDDNIAMLDKYIMKSASLNMRAIEGIKIYSVRNKYSLIKLKYQVQKIDNNIYLRLPSAVKKDIIKYLELEQSEGNKNE